MAVAAIVSVVTKLGEFLIDEGKSLHGVASQIEQVKLQLDQMQCFLRDAAVKQIQDERVRGWVRNVRDVANETENAIDTYLVEMTESRFKFFIVGKAFRLRARHNLGNKISKIQSKIRLINEGRTTFGIENLTEDGGEVRFPLRRVVITEDDDNEIVGFEDVKRKLIQDLINGGKRRRVVSIVGQGGLGKTTIAEKVYKSQEVRDYFDITIWLTISSDFELVNILKKGLEKLGIKVSDEEDKEYYVGELRKTLRNKRYLVVLDDVWANDFFIECNEALPDARSGSRVLLTSRSFDVAKMADPDSTPHELRFLTEEEGLELLCFTVFHNQCANSSSWDDLIIVAKPLVKKCGYLPLAIKVVGGLLSKKHPTINSWNRVLQTMDWQIDGTECMKVLALSFKDLPFALVPCFLYLACYPEDYSIDARSLLKMWIAEGFVQPTNNTMFMEDLADNYLEELAQRCLIQVTSRSLSYDYIKHFRMHDLLRELAVREAEDQNFVHINANQNGRKHYTARRLAHYRTDVVKFCDMGHLNSLLILHASIPNELSFRFLHVLELYSVGVIQRACSLEIASMVNLRYLGLRSYSIDSLPKNIHRLQNLQTLDIRDSGVYSVPVEVWHIKTLRHFLSNKTIDGPPKGCDLRELQTLTSVIASDWKQGLPCFEILRKLGLTIYDKNQVEAVVQLLKKLNHLCYLYLDWSGISDYASDEMVNISSFGSYEHIQSLTLKGNWPRNFPLSAAMLPSNLTKLDLKDSTFDKDPILELMKLRSLKLLHLRGDIWHCDKMVFPAGGFLHLERLSIAWGAFKVFDVNRGSFPVLKYLRLRECSRLNMIPDLNHVPTLQTLILEADDDLLSRTEPPDGEDWHKLKHIPSITRIDIWSTRGIGSHGPSELSND